MKQTAAICAALTIAGMLNGVAFGQQYFSNTEGAQSWDTVTANWGAASGGPYDSAWANGDAIFEGTAGTVTVSTVSADSLTFSVAGYTLTNGDVTLTGPMVAANANANISSVIAGSAGLVKVGSGTLTLVGANTYSGGTTVSNGMIAVNADGQLGASGEGITLAGGTLRTYDRNLTTLTRPLVLGAGGGILSIGYYVNYNAAITGGTGLYASGGDFVLQPPSANNLGSVTMSGSRLFINNADAIANNASIIITNGAKLGFQSASPTTVQNPITFASGCGFSARINNIVLSTTNAVFPASGSFIFNTDDAVTYGLQIVGNWPTLTGAMTFQVGGGNSTAGAVTIGAALSGAYGVTKSNPGVLILAASNTFSGGLTVGGGTVKLGHVNALGATNVTVSSGATLDLAGFSPQIRGLIDVSGLGGVSSGVVTNSGALATLSIVRANVGFGGTIAGPISILIPSGGASYQILSGNNTYTGLTTVASGSSLEVWNTNALGAVSTGTILTNASLSMKGLQSTMTFAPEPLSVGGACYLYLNTDSTLTNAIWTGPIALASNSVFNITRAGGTGRPSLIDVRSAITGSGALTKWDTNTAVMLSGANDYSGGTTLTSGMLTLGSATGLGTGPVTLTLGQLDLNGNSAMIGSLSGTTNGVIVDVSTGTGTNTLTINQTVAGTMAGAISNGLNKTLALVKTGNAVLTLSATNTFQGPVAINGGTLKLGVAAALTGNVSTVTVNSGGTLDLYYQSLNNGSRTVVIAGPGAAGQSGALANTGVGGSEAQVYNLTLSDDASIGSTGNKLNIYGTLDGGGHVLTVAGTGEINIRPNNGFVNLAGVTVNSGLFRLESNQNWAGPYTVNAGGKLDTYGTPRTEAGNVILNGGRLVNGGTGQMPATWTGAFSLTGTSVVDTTGGNITISNAVSGAGALTKIGTNALALCGTCTFGGALCVSNGTVTLNGSLAHANVAVVSNAVFNGSGTVHARVVNGIPDTMVVTGAINLAGLSLDLDVSGLPPGTGPYTLVDATGGTLVGRFAGVFDVPAGYAVAYYGKKVQLVSAGTTLKVY